MYLVDLSPNIVLIRCSNVKGHHLVGRSCFLVSRDVTDYLLQTAISLVQDDANVSVTEQAVTKSIGKEPSEAISLDFVYDFCRRCNITTRMRTGNKSSSPE